MLIAEPARMPARDQQCREETDESNARVQLHAKPIPPFPPPRRRRPPSDQQCGEETDESNARVQLHAKPIPPFPPPRSGFVQQTDRAADVLPQGGPHPLSQRTGRNAQLLLSRSRVNYHFPWSVEFLGSTP